MFHFIKFGGCLSTTTLEARKRIVMGLTPSINTHMQRFFDVKLKIEHETSIRNDTSRIQ